MNRNSIIRMMFTGGIILATFILRAMGLVPAAYITVFSGVLMLPLTGINLALGKRSTTMSQTELTERFILKLLLSVLLISLGGLWIIGKNLYPGLGVCAAITVMLPFHIMKYKKDTARLASGQVLWDERDMAIAGKAALITLRFQIMAGAVMILAIHTFAPFTGYQSGTPVMAIALLVSVSAFGFMLLYRLIRRSYAE
ncbi:MAG: DUF2178 domain-containing protein [Spirochaetales bacterium]|nr:DUF2178 domain-containing protein [Spirochaetales bacterium]